MDAHPPVTEADYATFSDGSLAEFRVLHVDDGVIQADPAPSPGTEGLSHGDGSFGTLCLDCSLRKAAGYGYVGPVVRAVRYQRHLPPYTEPIMVDGDPPTMIVAYSYGRVGLEAGEPRTLPCDVCGAETLRCNVSGPHDCPLAAP